MKKKITAAIFAALMIISCLVSCGGNAAKTDDGKLNIVTTVFPLYDWIRNIAPEGENATVKMLLDKGVDLHSFQPTADDIMDINTCDVFVYVGGESDGWVDDVLKNNTNPDLIVVDIMDALGDAKREEEVVEGMEEHEEEEEEETYDEHIWLSLKNASLCCKAITDALCKADAANADTYKQNAESYIASIDALDAKYAEATGGAENKTLVFGDRFPFLYMMKYNGIEYFAPFSGCSAESEASFETVTFLAGKVDELGLDCVMALESGDHSVAEQVAKTTASKDKEVLLLDSMQSVTGDDVKKGCSYIGIMEKNLEVLKKAIG